MNKRLIAILLNFIGMFEAATQTFGSLPFMDNSSSFYYLERVLTDSIHDKLLVSSRYLTFAGPKKVRGICSWNGIEWDSLQGGINTHDLVNNQPNGLLLGSTSFNGKLLVGGVFESIGGINATSLATWDGNNWDSLPVRAFKFLDYGAGIYDFIRFNNNLYLCGNYDTIQGQKANGLATYNGTSFQPVIIPSIDAAPTIICMAVYKGELYVGGNFYTTGNSSYKDIYKFNGSTWSSVGGSIEGATSSVASMVVYNNELYVGGYFRKGDGNASNVIMKWDGNNWHDVSWGNEFQNGGIWKLVVHHNKLYAFGSFDLAGDLKASKVAVYDGNKWCTYADSLGNTIYSAAVYKDTMYIAGAFKSINSDPSKKFISKLVELENVNECTIVGIYENLGGKTNIQLFPNPATDKIDIEGFDRSEKINAYIRNCLGQIVLSLKIETSKPINIEVLPSGIYFLTLELNTGLHTLKFLKE